MIGSPLTLYVNADDLTLVRSQADPSNYQVPLLFQGDTVPLEFQLLYRSETAPRQLSVVGASEYSVAIIIVSASGTQLAYQSSFSDDSTGKYKTGSIALNTAAIDTAIALAASTNQITAYLQIRVTDTTGATRTVYYAETIRINKTYISAATTVVPPSETAATESWVRGTFFPKAGTSGGDVKIMQSSGGYQFRHYVDDDGIPHYDRIT